MALDITLHRTREGTLLPALNFLFRNVRMFASIFKLQGSVCHSRSIRDVFEIYSSKGLLFFVFLLKNLIFLYAF